MEGLRLLAVARRSGLAVRAECGRLVVRGPRRAEQIVRQLIEHKQVVLPILAGRLPAEWAEVWEERAGIAEYDGGLAREDAEALALSGVLDMIDSHTPGAAE